MTVKSKLLGILEQQKGETLSGEKLAEELHCTRAAIWKAVKSLREEGYTIEAGQNKGYMLVKDSNTALFSFTGSLSEGISGDRLDQPCREGSGGNRTCRSWWMRCGREADSRKRTERQKLLFSGGSRTLSQCYP